MDKRSSFNLYLQELSEWNKKFNLTSITNPEDIKLKHFEDSLSLLQITPLTNETVIDVGSGAGFPGIPLKIACPNLQLTLLEATKKKVDFLKHIIQALGLKNAEAVWGRAEELAKEKREFFDLALSRAVAKLNVLCEYCLPLVKVGGRFIAYKEDKVDTEVASALHAIQLLGGALPEIKKVQLSSGVTRSIVIISKIAPTPLKYPRWPGIAKKRPL